MLLITIIIIHTIPSQLARWKDPFSLLPDQDSFKCSGYVPANLHPIILVHQGGRELLPLPLGHLGLMPYAISSKARVS